LPLRKGVEPAGKAIGHEQIDPDERSLEVHVTNGSLCEWRRTPSSNYRRWRVSQLLIGISSVLEPFKNAPAIQLLIYFLARPRRVASRPLFAPPQLISTL
jgi:hypothetical protein